MVVRDHMIHEVYFRRNRREVPIGKKSAVKAGHQATIISLAISILHCVFIITSTTMCYFS